MTIVLEVYNPNLNITLGVNDVEYNKDDLNLYDGENYLLKTDTVGLDVANVLDISNAANINGTLDVTRATTLKDILSVLNDATFETNVDISGQVTMTNTLNVTDATILNNTLSVSGATSLKNILDVTNATSLNNTLYVENKATFNNDISGNANLDILDKTTLNNTLDVFDATTLYNTLNVINDTSLNSKLFVGGATTLYNNLTTDGNVSLNSNLTVDSNTEILGELITDLETTFNDTLMVTSSTTLNNTLYVVNDTSLNNTLEVVGDTSFNNSLNVSLSTTLHDTLTVDSGTTLNSIVVMENDLSLNTHINIGGHIKGPSTMYIDPAAHGDNTGRVSIAGSLHVTGENTSIESSDVDVSDVLLNIAAYSKSRSDLVDSGLTIGSTNFASMLYTPATYYQTVIDTSEYTIESGNVLFLIKQENSIFNIYNVANDTIIEPNNIILLSNKTYRFFYDDSTLTNGINFLSQNDTLPLVGASIIDNLPELNFSVNASGSSAHLSVNTLSYIEFTIPSDFNKSLLPKIFIKNDNNSNGNFGSSINKNNLGIDIFYEHMFQLTSAGVYVPDYKTSSDTLYVLNPTTLDASLNVASDTFMGDTLNVKDFTHFKNTLNVTDATTLNQILNVKNATEISGNLTAVLNVLSDTSLNSTLNVSDFAVLIDDLSCNDTLKVSDATTLFNTLYVHNATTLDASFNVLNKTTLHDTLHVSKDTEISNNLIITSDASLVQFPNIPNWGNDGYVLTYTPDNGGRLILKTGGLNNVLSNKKVFSSGEYTVNFDTVSLRYVRNFTTQEWNEISPNYIPLTTNTFVDTHYDESNINLTGSALRLFKSKLMSKYSTPIVESNYVDLSNSFFEIIKCQSEKIVKSVLLNIKFNYFVGIGFDEKIDLQIVRSLVSHNMDTIDGAVFNPNASYATDTIIANEFDLGIDTAVGGSKQTYCAKIIDNFEGVSDDPDIELNYKYYLKYRINNIKSHDISLGLIDIPTTLSHPKSSSLSLQSIPSSVELVSASVSFDLDGDTINVFINLPLDDQYASAAEIIAEMYGLSIDDIIINSINLGSIIVDFKLVSSPETIAKLDEQEGEKAEAKVEAIDNVGDLKDKFKNSFGNKFAKKIVKKAFALPVSERPVIKFDGEVITSLSEVDTVFEDKLNDKWNETTNYGTKTIQQIRSVVKSIFSKSVDKPKPVVNNRLYQNFAFKLEDGCLYYWFSGYKIDEFDENNMNTGRVFNNKYNDTNAPHMGSFSIKLDNYYNDISNLTERIVIDPAYSSDDISSCVFVHEHLDVNDISCAKLEFLGKSKTYQLKVDKWCKLLTFNQLPDCPSDKKIKLYIGTPESQKRSDYAGHVDIFRNQFNLLEHSIDHPNETKLDKIISPPYAGSTIFYYTGNQNIIKPVHFTNFNDTGTGNTSYNYNPNTNNNNNYNSINYNYTTMSQLGSTLVGVNDGSNADGARFGFVSAINSDGTIMIIGQPWNNKVITYKYQASQWLEIAQISGSESFGEGVAISSDGTIIAVGAPWSSSNSLTSNGSVSVYKWSGSVWNQIGTTIDGTIEYIYSGASIALSDDGHTLVIGSPANPWFATDSGLPPHPRNHAGVVNVYRYDSYQTLANQWQQYGETLTGENNGDGFGIAVRCNNDASDIIISAPLFDNNSGKIYIYKYDNASSPKWQPKGNALTLAGITNFGSSISISADGNTFATSTTQSTNGDVHVFTYNSSQDQWQIIANASGQPGSYFGWMVSINNDATILTVSSCFLSAKIHYFSITNNSLDELFVITDTTFGTSGFFGFYISTNANNNILVVGAPLHNNTGGVIVYNTD